MIVRIKTSNVGCHFGTVGRIVTKTGDVLFEGPVRPYGFTSAARDDAEAEARRKGYQVEDDTAESP